MHPAFVAILVVIMMVVSGCGSPADPALVGSDARTQRALLAESEAIEAAATAFASVGIDIDDRVPFTLLLDAQSEPVWSLTVPPNGFSGGATVTIHACSGEVIEVRAPKWS